MKVQALIVPVPTVMIAELSFPATEGPAPQLLIAGAENGVSMWPVLVMRRVSDGVLLVVPVVPSTDVLKMMFDPAVPVPWPPTKVRSPPALSVPPDVSPAFTVSPLPALVPKRDGLDER